MYVKYREIDFKCFLFLLNDTKQTGNENRSFMNVVSLISRISKLKAHVNSVYLIIYKNRAFTLNNAFP